MNTLNVACVQAPLERDHIYNGIRSNSDDASRDAVAALPAILTFCEKRGIGDMLDFPKAVSTKSEYQGRKSRSSVLCLAFAFCVAPALAFAQKMQSPRDEEIIRALPANPGEPANGALSPAAKRAMERGPLPANKAEATAKAAADRAVAEAEKALAPRPSITQNQFVLPQSAAGTSAPGVVGGLNFAGLTDTTGSPPDTTGAIGPNSFVQIVNRKAGVFNRTTGAPIASGTLNQLANVPAAANSFDPQIIWDPTTSRFYYLMTSIFSDADHRLSFGFSRTGNPGNVTSDWCHYTLPYGATFPDYPKLGDSQFFIIFGVNAYNSAGTIFEGADIIGVSKPPAGVTCPAFSSFKISKKTDLRDATGAKAFTPVPANQIDTFGTGYVLARNLALPSNKLWLYTIGRSGTGFATFGVARAATVSFYTAPPNATQPDFPGGAAAPLLDTLDGRLTQAVQASDPRLGTFSLWSQHTIANGVAGSMVRWYEINPVPLAPVVQRQSNIGATNSFYFNAAIAPDRKIDGASRAFGNSFVIEYNVSSKSNTVSPRIEAASSVNGGFLTKLLVKGGVGPYRDFTCLTSSDVCRWGDYSGATPDPKPTAAGVGQVWGTNQFSGLLNPPPTGVNWRTQIFDLKP